MHIHILGVCGTFMGSLAQLAKALGHKVTGSDKNVYPPMSTQLESAGIEIYSGFDEAQLNPRPDLVVVGNVVSRGNPAMEAVLNQGIPYVSGPQWLSEFVLKGKWVLAVSGTHGKTTTSSMLAWILQYCGFEPGYLIGGVPSNFSQSAKLGKSDFFVIEADEYDTAFFDKRSKFVHYQPNTLVINNLEFDHADIFSSLADIQRQFHHLVRTVPGQGLIIYPDQTKAIHEVLDMGCWTPTQTLGNQWQLKAHDDAGAKFDVFFDGLLQGVVDWELIGEHNMANALAAIAAARHVGVEPKHACDALSAFGGVKRRLELRGEVNQIRVYDDFAHHPTAIATTLEGMRAKVGKGKVVAVIEPRSNTMKQGVHKAQLADSVALADEVYWLNPSSLSWDFASVVEGQSKMHVLPDVEAIVQAVSDSVAPGTHVVVMSNGGFESIHTRLLKAIEEKQSEQTK